MLAGSRSLLFSHTRLISNAAEERKIQLIFLLWIATYTRKVKGE